jgi:hypothetical protein
VDWRIGQGWRLFIVPPPRRYASPYGKTLPTNQAGPPGTVTRTKTSSHLPSASTAHRRGSTCDQYLSPAFPSRIQLQVSSLFSSRAFTTQIPPRWSPNTGTSASFTPYLRHRSAQMKHQLELSTSSKQHAIMASSTRWVYHRSKANMTLLAAPFTRLVPPSLRRPSPDVTA